MCGGHTYSVLCTVWATMGPGCSVVYGATRCRMTRVTRHRIVWREQVVYVEGGPRVRDSRVGANVMSEGLTVIVK